MYGAGQGNLQYALGNYSPYAPQTMYGSAAQMSQGLGAQIFNPESQYNANIITANRKEEMDARIATAQNKASFANGLMSAVGAVGGAMMGNPALFAGAGAGAGAGLGLGSGAGAGLGLGSGAG